ncbi:YPT35 [Candida oxycetoniae]|uniref:Endosomal/vacuolar adapter protein YPT35 n=1 Tax=Candida oxycetoniae TaxID=497107 RepID=A0AAI9SUQ4_9ASCO|nr:YPT35 [Candida oxycetoniae]KAI3403272.1 YPT35 [Candida oxycetoniae]
MPRERSGSQLNSILPIPIELNDGETLESHTKDHLSHITDVLVGEYHLIKGEWGSQYFVWQIKITLNDHEFSSIILYKRFSEILQFYNDLEKYYEENNEAQHIPTPPSKDVMSLERLLMSKSWLEERRRGLQWFLSRVLLDPVIQKCPVTKEFVLS